MPQRIQLSRAAGWRMPADTLKVDRSSKWGNPFVVGVHGPLEDCLAAFEELAAGWDLAELRGKNLACWCRPGMPCHADILLALANGGGVVHGDRLPAPFWQCDASTIYNGDALRLLRLLPAESFDVVLTDPPYSSGGFTRGDRMQKTSAKYVNSSVRIERPEFHGDNRDQRGFALWCSLWLAECLRVVRPGGVLMCFTDWRQLPVMSDAIQAGGWVWRGFVPWDKTEASRPQKGWFRTGQCEFVMLATKGGMGPEQERAGPCLPGVFRTAVRQSEKVHMTGKPLELIRWLLGIFPTGTRVLDPFLGGGTTLEAAKELGMHGTAMELSPAYCAISAGRLQQDVMPLGVPLPPAEACGVAEEQPELLEREVPA